MATRSPEKPTPTSGLLSKNFFENEMSPDETWRVGFVMISNLTGRVVVESSTSRISLCEWTALDPTQHNSNLVYIEFRKACSCWSEGGYRVLQGPLGVVEGPVHCPGFRIQATFGTSKMISASRLGRCSAQTLSNDALKCLRLTQQASSSIQGRYYTTSQARLMAVKSSSDNR